MSKMTVTAHLSSGETSSGVVLPVHRVAFERHFKVPFSSLRDEPFEERLLWLGWHATSKGRPGALGFDQWLDQVESLDLDSDEGDAPLDATANSGESLPQPSSPAPASHSTG